MLDRFGLHGRGCPAIADAARARGSLRLSLGHTSTEADVDAVLRVLPAVVARARQAALASSSVGVSR